MRRIIRSTAVGSALATLLTLTLPAGAAHAAPPPVTNGAPPAIALNHNNEGGAQRLEVFVVDEAGIAQHSWNWDDDDFHHWSTWEPLGTARFTGGLAAVRRADGSLEVFGRSTDGFLLHNRRACIAPWEWCGWERLRDAQVIDSPAVALNASGVPEVFVHGLDHRLFHTVATGTGREDWADWTPVGGPAPMRGSPTVTRARNGLDVFIEGTDRHVYNTFGTGSGYPPFRRTGRIEGQFHDGRLGATWHTVRDLRLPVVMTAGGLGGLMARQVRPGTFEPWQGTFGNLRVESVTGAGDPRDGAAVMYARFTDLTLRRQRITDHFVGGWDAIGPPRDLGKFSAPPAVFALPSGRHCVFGRGLNGTLFYTCETTTRQRDWLPWRPL
ncbi:hypothetical protein [Nonomuraea sp. GTA35]|uniref:hypothetical protein n=1 Tax=Nonomuraea sp. GTA35 TaxID=1676746 RepID=UPI0035C25E18